MSKPRVELQTLLEGLLGSRNVYFQPPESVKLSYPCIIYGLSKFRSKKANNSKYLIDKEYDVTIIDKNPDSALPDKLYELEYCNFDRDYKADNLNHWVFSLYW